MDNGLTIIHGARQSGKSTYVVNNIKGNSLVLTPNWYMAKMLQRKFVEHNISQKTPTSNRTGGVITKDANCRFLPYLSFDPDNLVNLDTLWLEEIQIMGIGYLHTIVKTAQKMGIPVFVTFTPTVVSVLEAHRVGWLNIGQWYDTPATCIDLMLSTKPYLIDFQRVIPEHLFRTEYLGEFILED